MLQPFQFELKELTDDGEITGLASTFSVDEGGDQVVRGAFAKSLAAKPDGVPMLWSHRPDEPIGRWTDLTENADGLHVKGRLILSVAKARETFDLLKSKVLSGLSIGYRTVKAVYDDKTGTRLLKEIDLFEISVVTFPMNAGAKVLAVKADEITTERDFERLLRDAGFARERAKVLTKQGFVPAADRQRDVGKAAVSNMVSAIRAHTATIKGDHNGSRT